MEKSEKKQLRRFDLDVLKLYSRNLSEMKMLSLDDMFSDEYLSVLPDGSLQTKEQVIKGFESGQPVIKSIKETEDSFRSFGNTALRTGKLSLEARIGQRNISGEYRFTHVFRKVKGKWELLHAQSTPIQAAT